MSAKCYLGSSVNAIGKRKLAQLKAAGTRNYIPPQGTVKTNYQKKTSKAEQSTSTTEEAEVAYLLLSILY